MFIMFFLNASLFFSVEEIEQKNISRFDFQYKSIKNLKIYLNGIWYTKDGDYVVWINDRTYENTHCFPNSNIIIESVDDDSILVVYNNNKFFLYVNQTLDLAKGKISEGDTRRSNNFIGFIKMSDKQ